MCRAIRRSLRVVGRFGPRGVPVGTPRRRPDPRPRAERTRPPRRADPSVGAERTRTSALRSPSCGSVRRGAWVSGLRPPATGPSRPPSEPETRARTQTPAPRARAGDPRRRAPGSEPERPPFGRRGVALRGLGPGRRASDRPARRGTERTRAPGRSDLSPGAERTRACAFGSPRCGPVRDGAGMTDTGPPASILSKTILDYRDSGPARSPNPRRGAGPPDRPGRPWAGRPGLKPTHDRTSAPRMSPARPATGRPRPRARCPGRDAGETAG